MVVQTGGGGAVVIEMRTKGAVASIIRLPYLKSNQPQQPIWLSVYRRVTMSPPMYG